MNTPYGSDVEGINQLHAKNKQLLDEIRKVVIGQDEVVKKVLICIFSRGHCLLIGVPGLAKTLLVHTIAEALDLKFSRIQFTPDLMPSDITGSEILNERKEFQFIPGPLFANIVLADEINRTPPKTQAALLEAMQERSITVGSTMHKLQEPFFVLATQNPIEQEGTYPLPEAQLDRFMLNVILDYPRYEDELNIVRNTTSDIKTSVQKVISAEEILHFQHLIRKVPVANNVLEYAVKLANKTRPSSPMAPDVVKNYVDWGAGPRASQNLTIGAKCHAVLNGKYSPDIEDVQAVAHSVLRHRVVKNYKAEAEGLTVDEIINRIW
ncbi:MAG: MoxR family ATPase [Sphingobacteriales bacterium]|nr:MAG: MoxR family ATPase [Sphingobacteriales bacterium]